ncbi:MAG: hypothetical protein E7361_02430 [Clostridiales bacterium]|nr:hypothetical protein [Clostridiales bacterium]
MIYNLSSFVNVLSTIGGILLAIILFAVLIFIHELGHYTAGKIFKFKINEFSLGFGKALYTKKKANGEVFSIRLVPLGGYCAFEGEEGGSDVEGAFNKQAWWKRLIVLFSGVLFNFISAIIVSIPLLMIMGEATPIITSFADNTPNHIEYNMETLQEGDIIMAIDGVRPSYTNGGMSLLPRRQGDTPYTITVDRDGVLVDINVTNIVVGTDEDGNDIYGIGINGYENKKLGFFHSVARSVPFCFEMSVDCIRILGELFTGQTRVSDLGGPIATIGAISTSVSSPNGIGLQALLLLFPVIAVNLAVFNFLPLPALDGGRAVFVIIEGIRRKPINPKIENAIHSVGIMVLFAFVIFVDFLQIFKIRL